MDLFKKCENFNRHKQLQDLGCYPYFLPISKNEGPIVIMNGKEVIMAGTNNYLGLTNDPRVKQAAMDAIKRYGTSCSGSPLLNGNYDIHIELEEILADFVDKEAALLFSTGFQTNQGCITPLIGKNDFLLVDRENHSSIVQGALILKGMFGKDVIVKYKHNDMEHLEKKLSKLPIDSGKLIVSDGVFSMTGDIVNLPKLEQLAKKYNSRILIDDAHGLGVLGNGKGTCHYFNINSKIDIIMGTFSKSFASLGGFIASKKEVVDYIRHHSPSHIFSASMTPAQIASIKKSIDIIKEEPERIERLFFIQNKIRKGLKEIGYNVPDGQVPIVPIIIGDDIETFKIWQLLFDRGIFVNAIISPAVPWGMQLLRLSFMSTIENKHIDYILESFEKIWEKNIYLQEHINVIDIR